MRLSGWEEYQLSKIIYAMEKLHLNDSLQLTKMDVEKIIHKMKSFGKQPRLSLEEIISQLFPGSNTTVHSSIVRKYFECRDIPIDVLKKANSSKTPLNSDRSLSNLRLSVGWMDVDVDELNILKESNFQEANQLFTSSLVANDKELSKKYLSQALEASIIGTRLESLLSREEEKLRVHENNPLQTNANIRTDFYIVPNSALMLASRSDRSTKLLRAGSTTVGSHGTLRGTISRPSVSECRTRSLTLVDAVPETPKVIYLKTKKS